MTTDKLKTFATHLMETASKIAVDQECQPIFFLLTPQDEMVMLPMAQMLGMENDEQKMRTFMFCRALTKVLGAKRVGMVTEAWIAEARPGETMANAQRPGEREDRKEAITIMAQDAEHVVSMVRAIDRWDGQPTKLGPVLGGEVGDRCELGPGRSFYDWDDITPGHEKAARALFELCQIPMSAMRDS